MLKNIILTKEEAFKLPSEIRSKYGKIKKCVDDYDFDRTFCVFRDIEGKSYLLTHGKRTGLLQLTMSNGDISDTGIPLSMMYELLVDKELIADGDELNVICCYGNNATMTQERLNNMGLIHRHHDRVNVVNTTSNPCTINMLLLNNGTVRVTIYDIPCNNNKKPTIMGYVKAMVAQIVSSI